MYTGAEWIQELFNHGVIKIVKLSLLAMYVLYKGLTRNRATPTAQILTQLGNYNIHCIHLLRCVNMGTQMHGQLTTHNEHKNQRKLDEKIQLTCC